MIRRLALLLLLAAPALAQRATPSGPAASAPAATRPVPPAAAEKYHEAARLYVDGENAPALAAAEAGLALAPGDARLTALRDLIRQEQPPQDGGGPPPPTPPETPPDGSEPPPPGESPDAPAPSPGTPPAGPDAPPEAPPDATRGESAGPRMSRAQAEQILDAVGGTERLLLRQMRREPSRVRQNEIDW